MFSWFKSWANVFDYIIIRRDVRTKIKTTLEVPSGDFNDQDKRVFQSAERPQKQ
jgi:hypothetical protein